MSKAKFKVGDKVRILDGSKIKNYTGGWVMSDRVGKIGTIRAVNTDYHDGRVSYLLEEFYCRYDERGLELVEPEKIIIYRNGAEVIAKNIFTGKTGVAKCSPEDEFNFEIGAKLALERLFSKFKVGDKIIGTAEASKHYGITKEGWRGTVTNIDADGTIEVRARNNGDSFWVASEYFKLDDSSEYFNGKVVCVIPSGPWLTKGKIYEIKDGVGYDNEGDKMTAKPVESVEDLNEHMASKFMEIVE